MRSNLLVKFAVAGAIVLMGCEQPAAVESSAIVGTWNQPTQQLSPTGTYEFQLTFTQSGKFTGDGRMYGVYGGQAKNALSAYTVIEGTYATDGYRLLITPRRLTTWDIFYGASSKKTVQEPYPYSGYLDDARYEIDGRTLTLKYTTYPADAPVPTTMDLKRGQ